LARLSFHTGQQRETKGFESATRHPAANCPWSA
jgi:hypothetical protein